ncbi:MAG: metallophosphoesterase [Planctomycetia bacterium]|nr:metallophosphoesterase [Planctomycetia bacterium]
MSDTQKMSRRQFGQLVSLGLAGLSGMELVSSAPYARAEEPTVDPDLILWVSDTHVPADAEAEINQTCPAKNLRQIFEKIAAYNPHPASVCFCGDTVALEGKPEDYRTLRTITAILDDAGIPWYVAFGNHDNREAFYDVFPEKRPTCVYVEGRHITVVETPHADLVLLDSLIRTNHTPGELGEPQTKWIRSYLKETETTSSRPVYFAAHHPLVPGTAGGHSGLLDTDAFLKAIDGCDRVKGYIFGHSHAWGRYKTFAGMTLPVPDVLSPFVPKHITSVNLPATGWLFADQPRGWVEMRLTETGDSTFTLRTLDPTDVRNGAVHRLP